MIVFPVLLTEHTVAKNDWTMPLEIYADGLVAMNKLGADLLAKRYPTKVVRHIPIPCPSPIHNKRKRGKTIAVFGFLNYAKGFASIIRAMKELPDVTLKVFASRFDTWTWNKYGKGKNIELISTFLPENILLERLSKEVDAIIYWYKEGNAVSGSSAVAMGMATGVPCVTSSTSWFRELPTYKPRKLVDGIDRILQDDALRQKIIDKQYEYCEVNNAPFVGRAHEELWDSLRTR
jgi:glycosyltransferase involved in cell wall biosynthesis